MSQKILQVNFKFSVSPSEYEQAVTPAANPIANTPGLRWKVWLKNDAEREAGGSISSTTRHQFKPSWAGRL